MEITAAVVKELREKTGLGMMDCKKALAEANGDMQLAIENLRKTGLATAAKRAGKSAKEGKVTVVTDTDCAIIYEVNSETDFVARNDDFVAFVDTLGKVLLKGKPENIDAALDLKSEEFGNITIASKVTELIGKIGEKISFRRYNKIVADGGTQKIFTYTHGNGKIGVAVKLAADKTSVLSSEEFAALGKDIAMQIAAANPIAANIKDISESVIAKEKEIYYTQAQTSGKPEKIWDKIVDGKLDKFFQEVVLVQQNFIKNPDITITERINEVEKATGAKIGVDSFFRIELGTEE
ncbi:MAG: elongation factor Ts [Chitinispirillaceae bacterium]|nr:elongation factor Ts [Chitinispirillaceae bacterium]